VLLKWLTPGLGVKRWLGLLMLGVTLLGLGIAFLLVDAYRTRPLPFLFYVLTLRGLPSLARAALAGGLGLTMVVVAVIQINRSIIAPFAHLDRPLVEAMMDYRRRQRGPKIVAIGGGTGLPILLRGLKAYTDNLTAIVTVADDGGSSGRLRQDLGVLPPGDLRNNIAALADDEALMTQLFQYRFGNGGLEGHSFGNLFITALASITGSFEQALVESSRVLAVKGQVLPSTLEDVSLMAELRTSEAGDINRVRGESAIPESTGVVHRVFLQPDQAHAYPEAVRAILSADIIVLGPGSLYTSILPNLLVPGIAQAIRASDALKVYVCNVATQAGETDHYAVDDHIRAFQRHIGENLFDVVLVNDYFPHRPADANYDYVRLDLPVGNGTSPKPRIRTARLADDQRPWRHDSDRLAGELIKLTTEERSIT
jgi:uncharacterized cofD-like protein